MTTFELAGQAMLQLHEGNTSIANAIAGLFRSKAAAPVSPTLAGATFIEQEPDLASEAHIVPEHMRTI